MDRESKEWYAIKSIRKAKVSKIEVLKREIQILKEVKHPNIIELIDVFEDSKYLHLVTELCTGKVKFVLSINSCFCCTCLGNAELILLVQVENFLIESLPRHNPRKAISRSTTQPI